MQLRYDVLNGDKVIDWKTLCELILWVTQNTGDNGLVCSRAMMWLEAETAIMTTSLQLFYLIQKEF